MRRAFDYRDMRQHTERLWRRLPEIRDCVSKRKKHAQFRTNRLMWQVYRQVRGRGGHTREGGGRNDGGRRRYRKLPVNMVHKRSDRREEQHRTIYGLSVMFVMTFIR